MADSGSPGHNRAASRPPEPKPPAPDELAVPPAHASVVKDGQPDGRMSHTASADRDSKTRPTGKTGMAGGVEAGKIHRSGETTPPPGTDPPPAAAATNPSARARVLTVAAGGRSLFLRRAVPRVIARDAAGSITKAMELAAMANPLYRLFLRRMPGGKLRTVVATGCGCSSGCGCGAGCCSIVGCFWPLLLVWIIVGALGIYVSGTPTFVQPLFCQANQLANCDGVVNLQFSYKDLPPGAVNIYKQAEIATGVPWFYLAAWEKVSTDFGKATLSGAGQPNGTALAATYAALDTYIKDNAKYSTAIAPPGTSGAVSGTGLFNPDTLTSNLVDAIKRLTSNLRGGSFGLDLATSDEYARFGLDKATGKQLDVWNRQGAAQLLGRSMVDTYSQVAASGVLRDPGSPIIEPVPADISNWISITITNAASVGDFKTLRELGQLVGLTVSSGSGVTVAPSAVVGQTGRGAPLPTARKATPSPLPPGATVAPSGPPINLATLPATWPSGPAAGRSITPSERLYLCNALATNLSVTQSSVIAANVCALFVSGSTSLNVDPKASFATTLGAYYRADAAPGAQITDWARLRIVMGAILNDSTMWGGEQNAFYTVLATDSAGNRTGAQVRVNAYVQGIHTYARAIYDSWTHDQGLLSGYVDASGALSPAAAPAMRFWRNGIDLALAQLKTAHNIVIPWQALMAIIDVEGNLGCVAGKSIPSGIQGCWIFGDAANGNTPAVATRFNPAMTEGVDWSKTPGAAMNYCTYGFRHATKENNCGTATVTSLDTKQTITIPIFDFCDCYTAFTKQNPFTGGESIRTIDLTDAAISALGLKPDGFGSTPVTVQINRPAGGGQGWPTMVTEPTAAVAVSRLIDSLIKAANTPDGSATAPITPTILELSSAILARSSSCAAVDPTQKLNVVDPFTGKPLGTATACPYLASVLLQLGAYVAAATAPGFTPGYAPRFITETDVPSPWTDCAFAALAMFLDKTSGGAVKVGHVALRLASGVPLDQGASLADLKRAARSLTSVNVISSSGEELLTWDGLLSRLAAGGGALVNGSYANLPYAYQRWDRNFAASANSSHSVYVQNYDPTTGMLWLMDPLGRGGYLGEWISAKDLRAYAWEFGGYVQAIARVDVSTLPLKPPTPSPTP